MQSRRNFLAGVLAFLPGAALAQGGLHFPFAGGRRRYGQYRGRRLAPWNGPEKPGTIVIITRERALYHILPGGKAMRYGVGVGRAGFQWSGTAYVGRKAIWPDWRPPKEMIRRELVQYGRRLPDVMKGGIENPLGARALYLYKDGRDTQYRIHGTNAPQTIGGAVSSGCIRMLNEEVIELFDKVPIGTKVIVR
jgi:lipoprotein-anchoring transpeptidase ErfK/SrfK